MRACRECERVFPANENYAFPMPQPLRRPGEGERRPIAIAIAAAAATAARTHARASHSSLGQLGPGACKKRRTQKKTRRR